MRRFFCWVVVIGMLAGAFAHEKASSHPSSGKPSEEACGGCGMEGQPNKLASQLVGRKVTEGAFTVLASPLSFGKGVKEGATVKLTDLLKQDGVKGIILDFVGAKCPFSQQQLQGVAKALSQKNGKGVLVAAVFIDADPQVVRKALKERPLPTLVLWDKGGKVAHQWHIKATPTVVVVRKNGVIATTYEGMAPPIPDMYQHFFSAVLVAVANGSSLPPQPMMGHMGGG